MSVAPYVPSELAVSLTSFQPQPVPELVPSRSATSSQHFTAYSVYCMSFRGPYLLWAVSLLLGPVVSLGLVGDGDQSEGPMSCHIQNLCVYNFQPSKTDKLATYSSHYS